jgi:hypothetical protein
MEWIDPDRFRPALQPSHFHNLQRRTKTSGRQLCPGSSPLTTKRYFQLNQTNLEVILSRAMVSCCCHEFIPQPHLPSITKRQVSQLHPHNIAEPIFICRNKGNMTMRGKVASPACRSNMERSIAKSSRICDLLASGWEGSSLAAYITDRVLPIFFATTDPFSRKTTPKPVSIITVVTRSWVPSGETQKRKEKRKLKISHHHAALPHAAKCIMQTVSTSRASLDSSPGTPTAASCLQTNSCINTYTLPTSQKRHQTNKIRAASISHAEPG